MSIFVGKWGLYRSPIRGARRTAFMRYPQRGRTGRAFGRGRVRGTWQTRGKY